MHTKPLALIGCMFAVAGATATAAPAPGVQWQCEASAEGAWSCSSVARPEGPYPHAARPPHQANLPPAASPDSVADVLTDTMDWVPNQQLAADTHSELPAQCSGGYIEPPMAPAQGIDTVIGTIHASSAESELQQDPEIARFSGNVTLRQDERRVRADSATYYREEDRLAIEGDVQYREPGLLIRSDSATVNTSDRSGELHNARFVLHRQHTRGNAERIIRNADGTIDLKDGSYTQCAPNDDSWQLVSEDIHLDRDSGQGTVHHARLEVKGIPVAYTPYLRFPIDDRRMSGLLWPVFANSSRNGFDLAAPYYFNLAPNYDATFTPRYMDQRGTMAGGEFRYLNRWSEWQFNGAFLPDDAVYNDDRWITSLQQHGFAFGDRMSTRIDYTEVSDEDYLRNLNADGLEVSRSTHLSQTGEIGYRMGNGWQVQALAQQYQLLDPGLQEPYKMLPRIALSRTNAGSAFHPDYSLNLEYTVFEHQDATQLTGQRLYMEPTISLPMEWSAGFMRPTVGYQSISYNLDQSVRYGSSDSPSVGAPMFDLDSGLFMERDSALFGGSWVQTLEPRAYYLWVDREDHSDLPNFDSSDLTFTFNQLFRSTRFSGHDRIADANQASLSVTSRLINDANGREVVTASLGQIFYFDDRRVSALSCIPGTRSGPSNASAGCPMVAQSDSTSEFAAELQVQPTRNLRVSGTTLFDSGQEQVNEGGLSMHWTPDAQTIVNAGYRYRRDQLFVNRLGAPYVQDIDQMDFSAMLPLGEHWRFLARYQYDFSNDNSLEELTGIEYNSCCWAVRVVYQEGVDWQRGRDYGVYVQFMLRGLGGFGKNIDQVLRKSIFGYGEQAEELGFEY